MGDRVLRCGAPSQAWQPGCPLGDMWTKQKTQRPVEEEEWQHERFKWFIDSPWEEDWNTQDFRFVLLKQYSSLEPSSYTMCREWLIRANDTKDLVSVSHSFAICLIHLRAKSQQTSRRTFACMYMWPIVRYYPPLASSSNTIQRGHKHDM